MPTADFTAGLFKLQFKALGTNCVVQFRTDEIDAAKEFRTATLKWIKEFENTWSRFKPDSLICRINVSAGSERIALTAEQDHVIQLCGYTYRTSRGLIDPTSFPLTELWDQAAKIDELPTDSEISEVQKQVDWTAVEHDEGSIFLPEKGMALEIGGFGKEYAVDQLITLAKQCGIENLLVDLGRDVAVAGTPPHGAYWVVGAENARERDTAIHRLAITDRALATSGNGRRFRTIAGKKFGHIIDSRSGHPAETDVLTATCLASNCLTAGILSTSAYILGADAGMTEINQTLNADALIQTIDETRFSHNIHQHLLAS
ncbi:FAD:protein FMN transferase [Akkermansiaceae bacterium]|nr:FAD:protein FMN transferase [Akkermansiaceae bacterium]